MTQANLIDIHREIVRSDWVDYNGHMNVAYYVLVFDHATDTLLESIGLDEKHRESKGNSVFVAEAHLTYEKEVMEGNKLTVSTQVLDVDKKRIHLFHRMHLDGSDNLIATNELMVLSVNLTTRRVAPFDQKVMDNLFAIAVAHSNLPRPDQSGSIIGINKA